MKKVCSTIGLLLLTIFITSNQMLISVNADEVDDLNVEANSALLMEASTGKLIYEKNIHDRFAPASVTKIMTMLIAMEEIDSGKIKLNDRVVVSENAKKMGGNGSSSMLLDTGEVRTVEELLKGVAIASGNDASVAVAEYISGSEAAFVKKMNETAKRLNMKDTQFRNCHGLTTDGHYTTAYDISIMSRELIKHSQILKYTGTYMETISEGRLNPIGLVNHNKLVRFYEGCDGLKTGYTSEAKYCISATATKDGVRMLSVIMGAPSYKVRNRDASKLMNYGFSKFEAKKLFSKGEDVQKVDLNKKGSKYFIAKASEDMTIIIERGQEPEFRKEITLNLDGKKSVQEGEEIGFCEVYDKENLLGKVKIYSDREFKTANLLDEFRFNLMKLFDKAI